MKQVTVTIERSSYDKLKAYGLAKSNSGFSAGEYIGIPFSVDGFVISNNTITDLETGEVKTMKCLTLHTVEDKIIGTNSPTLLANFTDLESVILDSGLQLHEVEFIIRQGTGKNGKFNTIELVL